MDSLERAGYLAHAHSSAFVRKLAHSEHVVSEWLSLCTWPYISYSAGKDSQVVMDLVRRQRPSVPAIYHDDEWELPETTEIVTATPHLTRIATRVRHSEWFVVNEGSEESGGTGDWAARRGYDGAAIGLRADESRDRKVHIRAYGELFRAERRRVCQCYPLAWWTTRDVWAYILSREIPYNRAYDRLAEIGVDPQRRRIGPLAVSGAMERGQMAILKRGWPELYERFAERYPEAKGYV